MYWLPGLSTTTAMPTPLNGPGRTRRCVSGLRNMLREFSAGFRAGDTSWPVSGEGVKGTMSTANGRNDYNWRRVSTTAPCPVCNRPDWCSLSADGTLAKCMRVEEGAWRSRTDKTGARYHLHRLNGTMAQPNPASPPPPMGAEAKRADDDTLHTVYEALLKRLTLSKAHREALHRRGLLDEAIDRAGYRTLPGQGRPRLAHDIRE